MLYEMQSSRLDILRELGPQYTFSAERPFGTENKRVMGYLHQVFPALRNRMPEPWLKEVSRSNPANPGNTDSEYIRFQRGATTKTPPPVVKGWLDTTLKRKDTWLVLTFHGVDSIGWEALTHQQLANYFSYIKAAENKLWIATFGDVTRYMRERQSTKVTVKSTSSWRIFVELTHSLDNALYNQPLTLKTYVPADWKEVWLVQGVFSSAAIILKPIPATGGGLPYVLYQVMPNAGITMLMRGPLNSAN